MSFRFPDFFPCIRPGLTRKDCLPEKVHKYKKPVKSSKPNLYDEGEAKKERPVKVYTPEEIAAYVKSQNNGTGNEEDPV